jgi:hypothetical protein
VDELTRLHAERRAVDELAVDEDVTVHDELTSLRRGAGEAGTQHEGVEAHLEQLDEVLTGQAVLAAGLVERVAHLLLADAVLLAQTLLLAEADREVAVLLALGAAVLTGSVGTLLEVLGGLGVRATPRARERRTLRRSWDFVATKCSFRYAAVTVTARGRISPRPVGLHAGACRKVGEEERGCPKTGFEPLHCIRGSCANADQPSANSGT